MYSVEDLKRAFREPARISSGLNRCYFRLTNNGYNHAGIDIFDEDWDTLIVLDACRYDEFQRTADLPGQTEQRASRGSATPEWVRANFNNRSLNDTVYVSANSWYPKLREEMNTEIHAYHAVERDADIGFTSTPEAVTAAAREAASDYPQKRLIVHYLQPHKPFLGEYGRQRFENKDDLETTVRYNNATQEEVIRAYHENLQLVLNSVEKLLLDLGGRTVVTADHGELLGDRQAPLPVRRYGHPQGVYVPELVEVPWHVYEDGPRREIQVDPPEAKSYDIDAVEEQLKRLGYMA